MYLCVNIFSAIKNSKTNLETENSINSKLTKVVLVMGEDLGRESRLGNIEKILLEGRRVFAVLTYPRR